MRALLGLSRGVDALSAAFGKAAEWCVLAACAISAGNAVMRYGFSLSSNAWLEVQWYLFTGIVMLGAAHTLRRNGHVRVDLVYAIASERARLWIDVFGIIFFLLPGMALLAWMTWPFFLDSWMRQEVSPNAGGLIRWPVKLLLPLGFVLVVLQGLAELVKRIAALRGIKDEAARVAAYEKLEQ
jgi:TRAP-type mannitol/chloroaromatic compound transport system permease small subunit